MKSHLNGWPPKYEPNRDDTNRHCNEEEGTLRRLQPYTKYYRQLRNALYRRISKSQPCNNIHESDIQTKKVVFVYLKYIIVHIIYYV